MKENKLNKQHTETLEKDPAGVPASWGIEYIHGSKNPVHRDSILCPTRKCVGRDQGVLYGPSLAWKGRGCPYP